MRAGEELLPVRRTVQRVTDKVRIGKDHQLDGEATIGGRPVAAGQIAWSDPAADVLDPALGEGDSYLDIQASDGDRPTTVLLFSGRPLREPVAAGAPFVMNIEDEIRQAVKDYESGKFGEIPRTARL
jgi:redox-sensitive bicupin YhaK (pirin superfamily)